VANIKRFFSSKYSFKEKKKLATEHKKTQNLKKTKSLFYQLQKKR